MKARSVSLAVLAISLAAPAAAGANAVDLTLSRAAASHGQTVVVSGRVDPPSAQPVTVELQRDSGTTVVASGTSAADGTYSLRFEAGLPGRLVARTALAESAPVGLGVRPVLRLRLRGLEIPSARLSVSGRVLPAEAGAVSLGSRPATARAGGRFSGRLKITRAGRVCVRATTAAAAGFLPGRRTACVSVSSPTLGIGSRGPAVRHLERRLRALRYAIGRANSRLGVDTRDALLAFQKVERIPRTGVTGPSVWRALTSARTPKPKTGGSYIEISKSRQLLYEVRSGRVARIIHTSTGLTGNTPVGRFRIYRKDPGSNSLGMYQSLYFIGGFAIHGYVSVPTFPASHGCARIPMWLATGLFRRWPIGSVVRVLP